MRFPSQSFSAPNVGVIKIIKAFDVPRNIRRAAIERKCLKKLVMNSEALSPHVNTSPVISD